MSGNNAILWQQWLTCCLFTHKGFSALTLFVGRQEGHQACKKTEWWGAGVVICLQQGADLHMVQLMPLPLTVSCSSKIQIGFTFLVPAYPGCPGKEAVKWLLLLLLICWFVYICTLVCLHCKNHQFTAFLDSRIHTRLAIVTTNELALAFPPRNLPKKFRRNPSTFYLVIVVTDKQTDKRTPVIT